MGAVPLVGRQSAAAKHNTASYTGAQGTRQRKHVAATLLATGPEGLAVSAKDDVSI